MQILFETSKRFSCTAMVPLSDLLAFGLEGVGFFQESHVEIGQ